MSLDGNSTPLHHSLWSSTPDHLPLMFDQAVVGPSEKEKKKKGKCGSVRKSNPIPEYVHVLETVFSFSEEPFCSFEGHLDVVLNLYWSRDQLLLSSSMDKTVRLWDLETKTCLKLLAHNYYVTCIQFNPLDDNYFISDSLDAKIRLWNVAVRQVVDWTDLYEMVTAASYTPDG